MKYTRGLIFGFVFGTLIGLLIYLRLRRHRRGIKPKDDYLRLVVDTSDEEAALSSRQQDSLADIRGIGPVYSQQLSAAGIKTFAQLAALTPARLREIIGARVAEESFRDWIDQAAQFASRP